MRMEKQIESECLRDVRAGIFSVGGALVLAICLAVTVLAVLALSLPTVTSTQRLIAVVFALAAWAYFISSSTERLQLVDKRIRYSSMFGRDVSIPIEDLESMLLVHQGFNLERGIETIEFRRRGQEPQQIALGPCWQRHELEAFLHSVEEMLNESDLLEEVR